MNIIKATLKDLKEIAELRKNTIEKINSQFLPETDILVLKRLNSYFNLLKRIKKADMFCIKEKNKILGTIDLKKNEIKGFYVDYENQGKGIGSKLLDFIENYAKEKGIKKLKLECNKSAYDFYIKKGYILKKKKEPSGKLIKRVIYIIEKEI